MIVRLISVAVMLSGLAGCISQTNTQKNENISRCEIGDSESSYYVPMRGTAHYWLEYFFAKSTNTHTVILIKGEVPVFADGMNNIDSKQECSKQEVVDIAEINLRSSEYINSFECVSVEDMPNPTGEIVFGVVEDTSPGVHKPDRAWRAFIQDKGNIMKILEIKDLTNIYCPMYPTELTGNSRDSIPISH